jgi:hypothetical protein
MEPSPQAPRLGALGGSAVYALVMLVLVNVCCEVSDPTFPVLWPFISRLQGAVSKSE